MDRPVLYKYRVGSKHCVFESKIFPGTQEEFDEYQFQHLVSCACRAVKNYDCFTITKTKERGEERNIPYDYYLVEVEVYK